MERMIALYLRLSKADKKNQGAEAEKLSSLSVGRASKSIQNQQALLERYISQDEELRSYKMHSFIDDGFSGLENNRPALQNMLTMVKSGEVYAVIVKDFSRLSRNHLYLAELREKIFPSCFTELIALGDSYDSRKSGENVLALRFKSLFYEYYSRDISRKVKASLEAKKESGEYAVAKPPFGYRQEHGVWQIEEREATLVQNMFALAQKGYSYREIASMLEKEAAPKKLYPVKVMRILRNPVYCGKHVWHKYENYMGLHKKSVALPREQWRIEEGHHPAIISEDMYKKVEKQIASDK